MIKNEFFSHPAVVQYLNETDEALAGLPPEIRGQYIGELKADLYAAAEQREFDGALPEDIPQETVDSFLPPTELAYAILKEHEGDFEDDHKVNKNSAGIFTSFAVAGMGAMATPIMLGFMNFSALLPFMLAVITGTAGIMLNKKILWNGQMINYLEKTIKISEKMILILALGFFAVRIILTGGLSSFTLTYTAGYLVLGILFLLIMKRFYRNKKKEYDSVYGE